MTSISNSTPCDNESLASYSKRDQKWDKHRGNTQTVAGIYDLVPSKYSKLANRMHKCANILEMGFTTPDGNGEIKLKLISAMFCKVRHCPTCGWRRSMGNTARFFDRLPDLQAAHPTARWIFLTLTVENVLVDDLRATISAMNKAWQRLIQRKDWPALGWIRTVEVTHEYDPEGRKAKGLPGTGRKGYAHPHFHALLQVPAGYFAGHSYIKQAEWAERWKHALRADYLPVVDVRAVKPKIEGQTLQAAVIETLKYGTKVEDTLMHPAWLYGITDQLHKMRFLASGGTMAGILKEEQNDDEMIHAADGDGEKIDERQAPLFFQWNKTKRQYRRSR